MLSLFREYAVVWGMSEVMQRYVDMHDIAQAVALKEDLLVLYRLDVAKFAAYKDKAKVRAIFDVIQLRLDDESLRFVLADLNRTARHGRYESSFLWLADAGVALPCHNVSAPVPPLESNGKRSLSSSSLWATRGFSALR